MEAGANPAQPRYGKDDEVLTMPLGDPGKASTEEESKSGDLPDARNSTFHEG